MIFEFQSVRCILEILRILSIKKSKYKEMFRLTKVSHITLQSVLRGLNERGFIKKYDLGHQKVDYEITNKGRKLLGTLRELNKLVK